MDKAILVIDMPDSCGKCPLIFRQGDVKYCIPEKRSIFTTKPDWCPLKPAPEKYDVLAAIENNPNYDPSYDIGRNDCVDEILEE